MYKLVGILLNHSNKIYYFDSNKLDLKKGDKVVVELENYDGFGVVDVEEREYEKKDVIFPLRKVIRIADKKDLQINEENKQLEKEALEKAQTQADKLKLNMKFVDANFTFGKEQLFLKYISDDRVDFRELAKKLAQLYKTRIELRQIGIRDKAKVVGGLGPCGRVLCCNSFLEEFESVSINMAKNQFLSLNPTKINGQCGRLLCCLNYEDEIYTEMKKDFPAIGSIVDIDGKSGKVSEINILNNTYKVEFKDNTIAVVENENR